MSSRLFWDMDGTLAEWKTTSAFEDLFEEGYFRNLKPHDNLIEGMRYVIHTLLDVENFINSHFLRDSRFALSEKNEWLDEIVPEISRCNRIFSSCGTDKAKYVPKGLKATDILIDDYTPNLKKWEEAGGTGVKFMNGINGTKGTWNGAKIYKDDAPENIAKQLIKVIKEKEALQNRHYMQEEMER